MFSTFTSCSTHGCEKAANTLTGRCRFHSVIEEARLLSATDFDRVRKDLETVAPITDDERNAMRARAALRSVEWQSRDLKRSKREARKAGATEGQIADAVKRGKDGVTK